VGATLAERFILRGDFDQVTPTELAPRKGPYL
jgi:hypothetical protein